MRWEETEIIEVEVPSEFVRFCESEDCNFGPDMGYVARLAIKGWFRDLLGKREDLAEEYGPD